MHARGRRAVGWHTTLDIGRPAGLGRAGAQSLEIVPKRTAGTVVLRIHLDRGDGVRSQWI